MRSEKQSLEDRLKLEQLSKPSTTIGSNTGAAALATRGLGSVTRLEMEHDRLKVAHKALSNERAQWLITKEENEDLRNQVERLKQWRERALFAENALTEANERLGTSLVAVGDCGAQSVTPTRLQRLQRENQLLLAQQGELRER